MPNSGFWKGLGSNKQRTVLMSIHHQKFKKMYFSKVREWGIKTFSTVFYEPPETPPHPGLQLDPHKL